MPLLKQYIEKNWSGLITNTNCASSFDSHLIHTQVAFVLRCSICLRYRGCSSRASLHQLQWRGLPSPASMQLCVPVEMHCKLPHTHTIKVQTQTNYKHKDRTQTQTTSCTLPTTNCPHKQARLTLSTVHVLEDLHQLQGKKGLPPPSSLLRKAGQGAGGIYGPRARRTRHAYSLQKTQIYGTLAWVCWHEEGESRNRY